MLPSNAGSKLYGYATPQEGSTPGRLVLNGWGALGVLLAWIAVVLVPASCSCGDGTPGPSGTGPRLRSPPPGRPSLSAW